MFKKVLSFFGTGGDAGNKDTGTVAVVGSGESSKSFGCKVKEEFFKAVAQAQHGEAEYDEFLTTHADFLPFRFLCWIDEKICTNTFSSYSHFKEHLIRVHNLLPTTQLTTRLIIHSGDVSRMLQLHPGMVITYTWNPKWIRAHSHDFIFMMTRMAPGIWSTWLYIIASPADAKRFKVTIRLVKDSDSLGGHNKYAVLPITFPRHLIEDTGNCWQIPDDVIKNFSQIGDNFITSVEVKIDIIEVNPTVPGTSAQVIRIEEMAPCQSSKNSTKNSSAGSGGGEGDHGGPTLLDVPGTSAIDPDLEEYD